MSVVEFLEEKLLELFGDHLPFELLDEAKEMEQKQNQEIRQKSYMEGYDEGAKWQAERMYSEEEVKRILMKTGNYTKISLDAWFGQFKKK